MVTVADVFYLINYLFTNGPVPVGPADSNGDGQVTVTDVFYLISYLFVGGPPPVSGTLPVLNSISPTTVFQGDTIGAFTLTGSGLTGATAILFDAAGFTASSITSSADGTSATARLQVDLNAPIGATGVRISTPAGTSNAVTLQVAQKGGGLLGSFYNGATFDANGLPVISGAPLFQRSDSSIQFGASTGFQWRPCLTGSLCVSSSFSVRWEGMIYLDQAGSYTFATNSSDASRVQINGQDVVLNPGVHVATQKSGMFLSPAPGSYTLVVTFGSSSGTPGIDILYQSPSDTSLRALPSSAVWTKPGATTPAQAMATSIVSFFNPAPAPSSSGTTIGVSSGSVSFFNPDFVSPPKGATSGFATASLSFFNPAPLPLPSGAASPTGQGVAVVNGPAVLTVSPAQITRGSGGSRTLTLAGANLSGASAVTVNPSTGITVGTPTVSADGKTLTVTIGLTGSTPTGIVEVSATISGSSTPVTAQTRFEIVP